MKALKLTTSLAALALLFACGSEESPTEPAQTQEPEPEQGQVQAQAQEQARGVLTTTQQQALEAANSFDQSLLDAAREQEEELNRRLQRNQ
ncbi:MAG TPA: hypothetical protein DCS33_04075 [Gammaproteobacteria bacterium]|jgi:outer membrane biogenesis lipoprotein LolB|nr:hypothetical protein [Gammaproteobacteria bacterium]